MKNGKDEERLADLLALLSAVTAILAVLTLFEVFVYFAFSQWLLISAVMMLWAIYIHIKE